jgi:hypothetical protein
MLMKKLLVLPILLFSISCFADIYTGSFQFSNASINLKYTFDVTNKNDLKGTFEAYKSGRALPCWQGKRSIDGSKIDGADVVLIAALTPALKDIGCDVFEFVGKSEGNKLIGKFTFGQNVSDVVLIKEK